MLKSLEKYQAEAYALLRIVSGFLFSFHGMQKVLGWFGGEPPAFGTQIWLGGWMELVGGLFIMAGFLTRPTAFLCSGEMAVAYIQFHWKGQLGDRLLPGVNHGELAVLYAFVFLLIATRGPGTWAVDKTK